MVAQLNRLEESQLEMFLFGTDRTQTAKIRAGLWEIQERRCFYCDARIAEPVRGQVDHFVPMVALPGRHSGQLRGRRQELQRIQEQLAGRSGPPDSVDAALRGRLERYAQLADLAPGRHDRQPDRSQRREGDLPPTPNDARLWLRGKEFIPPDATMIGTALTASPRPIGSGNIDSL